MSTPLVVRIEAGSVYVREAPEVPGARLLLALSAEEARALAARLVDTADRIERDRAAVWQVRS